MNKRASANLEIHPLCESIKLIENALFDSSDTRTVSATWRYDPTRGGDRGSIFLHGKAFDVEEVATGATPTEVLESVHKWLIDRGRHLRSAQEQPSPYL